jgi:hypothetical protein
MTNWSQLGELILLDSTPANGEALPINMIDRSREASLAVERDFSRHDGHAEEEEALMASTDENDEQGQIPPPRPVSAADKRTRTMSSSVDVTPLSNSRNRTPLGSRRASRELEHPFINKPAKSRLSHEVDRSSLSIDLDGMDGNGFAAGAEESLHASLHELEETRNGARQSPPRPRKNKHEGTAEKAGVILVGRCCANVLASTR